MAVDATKRKQHDFVILVVDDRAEQRYVRRRILQREGYTIREASTGAEALRLVAEEPPGLVLLDVKLPDIDGIEVCRRIKSGQHGAMVLVLHISAHMTSLQDRLRALESGADGFLLQPIEMEEMVAVVRSLLRLHQAEAALRDVAREWKASFDAIGDGICLLDMAGCIMRHNQALAAMLGGDVADLTGEKLSDLIPVSDPFALVSVAGSSSELYDAGRWLRVTVNAVTASDATLTGLVCVIADVTERKAAEQLLAVARMEAEAANRAKSTFLAAASHDLRQPLQAMELFHDLLNKELTTDRQVGFLRHLHEGMQSLDSMLTVLMDVSTLESGAIKPRILPCRVDELLGRVAEEHQASAAAKGLRISVRSCDAVFETDIVLLERMIRNLVANALRYTESGRLLLSCRRVGETVRIQIWDTGIGIGNEDIRRIFDDYYQVSNRERDRSKGIGMGLPIVARMARLLNHRIDVRSQIGKGSVFTITAERYCGQPEDIVEPQVRETRLAGLRVALIEDDPTQLHGLKTLLTAWGCQVQEAGSAAAASTLVTVRPDVIVTDYRLPGGNSGLELVIRLREAFARNVPAILQTGDTDPELTTRAESLNLHVLHKPYAPRKLRALLGRLARR